MSYARYYVMPRSPLLAPKLNFTVSQPWIQVAIRGVDPGGKEIDTPPLSIQQGSGTLVLTAHCVYEMYFSDVIIDDKELDRLRKAGQPTLGGNGFVFSPSLRKIAGGVEDPPPPPPPGSKPGAPDVPFDMKNVHRI
ncbi:hypothetical protein [Sorangium sp. So ce887]|uniref:hypothetical protein n=1 Tax=Sorangium sp. So ce887 TaxID=3133324 RepID=UPI003F645899